MAAKKEPLFEDKPGPKCAGHPLCRFSGRLWVRTLQPDERLCVDHYYIFLSQNPDFRHDSTVPPKGNGMIIAKPVAGS